jgi:CRISPR-associated protein Cas1
VPDVLPFLLRQLAASTSTASVKTSASYRDNSLFGQLTAFPTLVRAFDRVEENQGGPGVDGEIIEAFSADLERNLLNLQHIVRQGRYCPHALLRLYAEKEDGSLRPLSIPTVRDRVLQTAAALVLTPILDPEFEDVSYAYRSGRSVAQAVQRIMALRDQGYRWVVDADIQRYFDEIPHDRLLQCLRQYVDDTQVLSLVRQWLTVEVEDNT